MSEYKHKHEFHIRPYDPGDCIVTKDNDGFDITVADSLPTDLAEWMCAALNVGIQLEKLWAYHNRVDSVIAADEWNHRNNGWQPIETAPTDTPILVKFTDYRGGGYAVARINKYAIMMAGTDIEIDEDHLEYWMPLPAPPEVTE